ncbi:MAG: hypothetical protein M1834_002264 [Cirrosporium novae-zelandiae]|nr:MAG: hypothetical protein M1834_002264 [Cirrosporium novae-zelandiae]
MCFGTHDRQSRIESAPRPQQKTNATVLHGKSTVELKTLPPAHPKTPPPAPLRSRPTQSSTGGSSLSNFSSLNSTGTTRTAGSYIQEPHPWTPQMLKEYKAYKKANKKAGADSGAYQLEKDAHIAHVRATVPAKTEGRQTFYPKNISIEGHATLALMAGTWEKSATNHGDLRHGFNTKYPNTCASRQSKKNYVEEAASAYKNADAAKKYMETYTRWGGQFN